MPTGRRPDGDRVARLLERSQDAFGNQTRRGTTNKLGLPAFHPFSTERYRYVENGSRIDDPDADSTRFTDRDKDFLIEPGSGDTIEFKSAEAPRYIPGFDVAASWAFQFQTFLQDDTDRFDLFVEGAYELRLLGDGTVKLVTIESGADNVVETATLPSTDGAPYRPELLFNWYDVGRAEWSTDYTEEGDQLQEILGSLTDADDWLSDSPVGRMGFRLDVSNGGIQLAAGSMAYIPQGDVQATGRPKPAAFSSDELNEIPADGYGVLGALRIDPERDQVYTLITEAHVAGEQGVDTEVWFKAVAPGDTDADFDDPDDDDVNEGPAYPRMNSPQNSVLQWTPNVSTFPTRTYAVDGSTIPTGRLAGLATESASGTGAGTVRDGTAFQKPRPVYPDDVVLMIGHTPESSTAQQPAVLIGTDQDW